MHLFYQIRMVIDKLNILKSKYLFSHDAFIKYRQRYVGLPSDKETAPSNHEISPHKWCARPGPEHSARLCRVSGSSCGPSDLQSGALTTELSRLVARASGTCQQCTGATCYSPTIVGRPRKNTQSTRQCAARAHNARAPRREHATADSC